MGEFKNDMKEGKGKYLFLDGSTKELSCTKDKCTEVNWDLFTSNYLNT